MASIYTPLGIELQQTGENTGRWGTTTKTNSSHLEPITATYRT